MEKKRGIKIIHVGGGIPKGDIAKTVANANADNQTPVFVVGQKEDKNIIEIEGVKYMRKAPQNNSQLFRGMEIDPDLFLIGKKTPKRPDVDIVSEFELIQQKKSQLSKSQRDWVVSEFNKLYEKVD